MGFRRHCDAAAAAVLIVFCLQRSVVGRAERVASQKCRQFIEQNTRKSYGGHLLLDATVHEISSPNCTSSVDLIVNGEEAIPNEFPHQARLGYASKDPAVSQTIAYLCGGSLISDQFVLTAAHCGKPKVVMLGEHNTEEPGDEVEFDVGAFIKHPKYRLSKSYHDIALVKLAEAIFQFSYIIRPACLWTTTPLNVSKVVATGFGLTEFGGNSSTVLMKVRLDLLSSTECGEKYEFHARFPDGVQSEQLCVGSQKGGKDTCQGDSGGPLQTVTDVRTCAYHIVGVTSIGSVCGTGRAEAVYAQVASYIDWIEQNVWPEDYRSYTRTQVSKDRIIFPVD
ncbi:serine protease snake-like [Sabethes cyaneus]|uniref:serine protease snake-like n=1 Tax=Sabethes cyaneus TaxID=53552 RepID=UPI00237D39D4|nr:serine protease snake-like [Sabethes cyaneus]